MSEKDVLEKILSQLELMGNTLSNFDQRITELEEKRGPKSSREMTEGDARRLLTGDMSKIPHRIAAERLGLSYGQVYSCRGGYTFRKIHDEIRESRMKKK